MEIETWIRHFEQNKRNRTEPAWDTPLPRAIDPDQTGVLARSLAQFHLGDGGGPGYLIAWNLGRYFIKYPTMKRLVDLWFAEEQEHSRLLGMAVKRYEGRAVTWHWSFSVFCLVRRALGIRFELYALLLTEIVSNNYYKMLRKYSSDPALRAMCDLIIRDETGHIVFHQWRLAFEMDGRSALGQRWALMMHLLAFAAGTMLWINHRPALAQFGATTFEFYLRFHDETERFIRKTRKLRAAGRHKISAKIHGEMV